MDNEAKYIHTMLVYLVRAMYITLKKNTNPVLYYYIKNRYE